MFTHLKSNDAQLYKENKNMKYNMFIHNGSNMLNGRTISTNEKEKI